MAVCTQRDEITENIYKLFYCNAMNMVLNYFTSIKRNLRFNWSTAILILIHESIK